MRYLVYALVSACACGGDSPRVDGAEVGAADATPESELDAAPDTEPDTAPMLDAAPEETTPPDVGGAGNDWTPLDLSGLDLYLDARFGFSADGGSWRDQGPRERVFTQDEIALRPRLDSGAVRFVRGQHLRLALPVGLPEGSSVFAVVSWTAEEAALPPPGNVGSVPLTLLGDGANAYGAFGAAGGAIASNHYVGGPVYVTRGEGMNDGRVRLIGASTDQVGVTKIYRGSAQLGVDDNSAPLVGANSYDTIGAGYAGLDGWEGEVYALVVVAGEMRDAERVKLDGWAEQHFDTPRSPPLDPWVRETLDDMPLAPDEWYPRDGAQMTALASGRALFIGGWNPRDQWGARTTNEVWASDDRGASWRLLLPHDPAAPRFPPGHTVGVASIKGYAVVVGSDALSPPYLGEVWRSDGEGASWTRVTSDAPSVGRCLFMLGALGDDLYVMGGQTNLYDPATGIADVWRSPDGGVSWEPLDPPPWSPRGMVYRPVALGGRLFVIGGGLYADAGITPVAFNGVYAFDGSTWQTVLRDGHDQFAASYYNPVAALDGRLWLFNGFTGTEELVRLVVSDDAGLTWTTLPGGPGGDASHADATLALADRILRVSGNLSERRVYAFRHR